MLAIIGASGKIGGATLSALLEHSLSPASQIVCTTSSGPGSEKWDALGRKGVEVRPATFDDAASMRRALSGCRRLFLVSSPRIQLDFHDAPEGEGREKDHYAAIDAAVEAGVEHIYYTSLAFANPSRSSVMTAHERTEARLKGLPAKGVQYTIIREGLYNESWPLYLGHYAVPDDDRTEIVVAGDGRISWTAIADLGLANALVLAAPEENYAGKVFYLSNDKGSKSLSEIVEYVSDARGKKIDLKVVPKEEYIRYYTKERNMDEGLVKWWADTYSALVDGECDIKDSTFEDLLRNKGVTPKPIKQTVREMLGHSRA